MARKKTRASGASNKKLPLNQSIPLGISACPSYVRWKYNCSNNYSWYFWANT